eukprot:TRINITY_DN163010_c0_g1_i1.p1 TRINITY_DN163010_c0_g1~~TRINITY_DN163010_c0_g1_i1.p1  ORF type:complete len:525 (+),score=85.41 TRINITY_DN163010_c0_g1_i1:54-1628(+)
MSVDSKDGVNSATYGSYDESPALIPQKALPKPNFGNFSLDGEEKSNEEKRAGNFSFLTGICFSVNNIVGSGVLSTPYAFNTAGYMVSLVMLLVVTFFCDLSKTFQLESMARAEGKMDYEKHRSPVHQPLLSSKDKKTYIQSFSTASRASFDSRMLYPDPNFAIKLRKFELTELCYMFGGASAKIMFILSISANLLGSLWAYSSIFSQAFEEYSPLSFFGNKYHLGLIVFAIIVIPLACMELKEQIVVQIIMSIMRFVNILLMVGTVVIAMISKGDHFSNIGGRSTHEVHAADYSGLIKLLPIIGLSQVFHSSIPVIAQSTKSKKNLSKMFRTTFVLTFLLYASCGLILSLYFGSDVENSCNLNWKHYTAGYNSGEKLLWVRVIEYVVVLFPAVDVLSAFPLAAISLGNNFLSTFSTPAQIRESSRCRVTMFRLMAVLPPLVLAWFIKDLGQILDYGGLGSWCTFAMPCIIYFFAYRWSVNIFGSNGIKGPYSNVFTNPKLAIGLFALIVTTAFVCLVALLLGWD